MADGPMTVRSDNVVEKIVAPWWKHLGVWVYAPVVLIVLSVLAFVYLMQASYVASQVETMSNLEQELHQIKQAISETRLKIADHEGLERLQAEAREMGFRAPESVEYIEVYLPAPQENDLVGVPGRVPQALGNPQGSRSAGGLISSAIQQFRDWTNPRDEDSP